MKIVNLSLSSYVGLSPGAIHIFGELQAPAPFTIVELEYRLNPRQAAFMNKRNDETDLYYPGFKTTGFYNKRHVITYAIRAWLKHFPDATYLVEGRIAIMEPKILLAFNLPGFQEGERLRAYVADIVTKHEDAYERNHPRKWDVMNHYYEKWKAMLIQCEEKYGSSKSNEVAARTDRRDSKS